MLTPKESMLHFPGTLLLPLIIDGCRVAGTPSEDCHPTPGNWSIEAVSVQQSTGDRSSCQGGERDNEEA